MLDNIINFWIYFVLLWPNDRNCHVFTLDTSRWCLHWQLRPILTFQPIYNPFKFYVKWRLKCKIWLNVNLSKICWAEKICNVPLHVVMCPLQIINWHWTGINPSWFNWMLCLLSVQCQNYSSCHKLKTN